MAQIWAENSYCQRRKVGALIVKDKMIISDGYNGTPAGFENCAKTKTATHFLSFCMPRQMPSPKSLAATTAATERLYT